MRDTMRKTTKALATLTLVGASLTLLLSCTHTPSLKTKQTVFVLKGARVIDGTGAAPRDNASIIIRNGAIETIQNAQGALPDDAQILDVTGKTIIPALIATHSHLGLTNGAEAGAKEITETNVTRQLRKFARYGIGTVASLGTDHDFIYAMRERRRKTANQTPYLLTAGRGFGVFEGAPPISMGMDQVYRPLKVEQVDADMKELAAKKPDLVKVWVDDFNHSLKTKMNPTIYRRVIQDAHANGLKVVAHVYYLDDAKKLAADGVNFFGHSVRDRKIDKKLVELMKEKNIAYIPTLQLDDAAFVYAEKPSWMKDEFFKKALDPGVEKWLASSAYKPKEINRKNLKIAQSNVVELYRAGVRVGLGTDSGATINRIQGFAEHRELELLVQAGLTPMETLHIATGQSASILGVENTRGVLAAGKVADLIVLNADPLNDIRNTRNIHAVWLEGVKVADEIDHP